MAHGHPRSQKSLDLSIGQKSPYPVEVVLRPARGRRRESVSPLAIRTARRPGSVRCPVAGPGEPERESPLSDLASIVAGLGRRSSQFEGVVPNAVRLQILPAMATAASSDATRGGLSR